MAIQQGNVTEWIKSSYSANGACVEVKSPAPKVVAVRDSKVVAGPSLSFPPGAWTDFVSDVRDGGPGRTA
jgi:uncharacterized protein DUF397